MVFGHLDLVTGAVEIPGEAGAVLMPLLLRTKLAVG